MEHALLPNELFVGLAKAPLKRALAARIAKIPRRRHRNAADGESSRQSRELKPNSTVLEKPAPILRQRLLFWSVPRLSKRRLHPRSMRHRLVGPMLIGGHRGYFDEDA